MTTYKSYRPTQFPLNLKGLSSKEVELWQTYIQSEESNTRRMLYKGVLTQTERSNRDGFHDANNELLKALVKL